MLIMYLTFSSFMLVPTFKGDNNYWMLYLPQFVVEKNCDMHSTFFNNFTLWQNWMFRRENSKFISPYSYLGFKWFWCKNSNSFRFSRKVGFLEQKLEFCRSVYLGKTEQVQSIFTCQFLEKEKYFKKLTLHYFDNSVSATKMSKIL